MKPVTAQSSIDPTRPALTADMLMAAPWRYGVDGEEPMTENLQFFPGGVIGGFDHVNERSWELEASVLVIRDHHGSVTARFSAVELQPKLIVLRAPYEPFAHDAAQFFFLRLERDTVREPAGPAADAEDAASDKALVERFESLGHDCEFGLLQRSFGAEPMGLMRWGGTHVVYLIEMLNRNLEGLGDPASCELCEIGGELYLVDRQYHLTRHTFTQPRPSLDRAKLLQQHLSFFDFLKTAFRESLEEGDLLFVYKDLDNIGHEMVRELSVALRRHGPARVLVVHQHGVAGAEPTLERVSEHAWLGHIDQFGLRDGKWKISTESWVRLLRMMVAEAG